jgi:hypothetical protein
VKIHAERTVVVVVVVVVGFHSKFLFIIGQKECSQEVVEQSK